MWGNPGAGVGQFNRPLAAASDASGNVYVADAGNSRIQVFSLVRPAPIPMYGVALNGSFEDYPALAQWAYGGTLPVAQANLYATDHTYALQLGAPVAQTEHGEGQAWANQTFYVDSVWGRPVLSFDYRLFVNDTIHFSDFFVEVQDAVGLNHLATVLRDGFWPCTSPWPAAGTDLGWRSASFDLSAFKGQSVRVVFANRNLWPESWGIWSYVDNVRVVDGGALPNRTFLPLLNKPGCGAAANESGLSTESGEVRVPVP